MLHCAILGDSLAQGVAILRSDCLSDTKVGISSASYVSGHIVSVTAQTALLSLGVNDGPPTVETVKHLLKLREGISAQHVYWMLPARPAEIRGLIQVIARMHCDTVIETRGSTGPDGLHLTGPAYRHVAGVFEVSGVR